MTNLVFEKLAQTMTAGQFWHLSIAGDFFRIDACEWPVTVALYKDGREVGRMSNVRAGDYVRDVEFQEVRIINGAVVQPVTVQIAGGGVGSDRVIGEVSIISGEVSRTKQGVAFYGSTSAAAIAGQYGFCQLWNPLASGKNAIVTAVRLGSSSASRLQIRRHNAALGVADLSWPNCVSKLTTGAASSMEIRAGNGATISGERLIWAPIAAGIGHEIVFREPVIVEPGSSLIATATDVNTEVLASFEFWQESR